MRTAPPVQAVLADGRTERVLVMALHALASAVAAHWLLTLWAAGAVPADGPTSAPLSALAMLLVIGLATAVGAAWGWQTARRLLPARGGQLAWTGAEWRLAERADAAADAHAGVPGCSQPLPRLSMAIDAGGWILLRANLPGGLAQVRWLCVDRRSVGGTAVWHALRVALQAQAGGAALATSPAPLMP